MSKGRFNFNVTSVIKLPSFPRPGLGIMGSAQVCSRTQEVLEQLERQELVHVQLLGVSSSQSMAALESVGFGVRLSGLNPASATK